MFLINVFNHYMIDNNKLYSTSLTSQNLICFIFNLITLSQYNLIKFKKDLIDSKIVTNSINNSN